MLVRKWQLKYQVFYQFFYVDEKLHIKSFPLIPSRLYFYVKVKIYTEYQFPIFFNESTYLLIKFLALISSFLYLYGLAFTTSSRRPGDDPVKRARAVWKLRAFEIQHGRGYEFLHNVEEFFETIFSLFNQSNACLELRNGDQAEFLSRRLEQYEKNSAHYVSTPNGNQRKQLP